MRVRTYNKAGQDRAASCAGFGTPRFARLCRRRYVSCAMRNAIALLMIIPALSIGSSIAETESVEDFYITITANDLYLCGEGFGGMYGCIDEAVSREAKSVVISGSSDATVQAVQELVNAVHAVGFDRVGVATFYEDDT